MSVVLCTREEQESSLAHGLVLCTQEQAEDYLMHWRTRGSKNGQRRWQDEQGRLTPAGYQHYAEMYGWNKRVKKAESLQNKADKANEKATSAVRRSDEAVVKAYNATRKNERKTNDRRQAKADKLNAESERRKVLASQAKLDAMNAQKKAVDYADKLQRKEDKMAKYVDDKGNLTEEAQNKYTYATSNPGEKKMSLLGRIKFGNEYSNKFNKEHKAQTMTDGDKFDLTDSAGKEFTGNKELDDKLYNIPKEAIENRIQNSRDWYNDEQYETKEERVASLKYFTENPKKFRDLALKNVGDDMLSYLNDPQYKETETDDYKNIRNWLFNEIDSKSGNWNVGEFHKGTNGERANDKLNKEYEKAWTREEEIKKDINYKPAKYSKIENSSALPLTGMIISGKRDKQREKEYSRLKQALKSDSLYQSLNENSRKAESDLCGAVLKDLGFRDTPENRSLIYQYIFYD